MHISPANLLFFEGQAAIDAISILRVGIDIIFLLFPMEIRESQDTIGFLFIGLVSMVIIYICSPRYI